MNPTYALEKIRRLEAKKQAAEEVCLQTASHLLSQSTNGVDPVVAQSWALSSLEIGEREIRRYEAEIASLRAAREAGMVGTGSA